MLKISNLNFSNQLKYGFKTIQVDHMATKISRSDTLGQNIKCSLFYATQYSKDGRYDGAAVPELSIECFNENLKNTLIMILFRVYNNLVQSVLKVSQNIIL